MVFELRHGACEDLDNLMVPVLLKHLRESKSPNHGVLGRKYYNMNGSLVSETQMFGSLDL